MDLRARLQSINGETDGRAEESGTESGRYEEASETMASWDGGGKYRPRRDRCDVLEEGESGKS